MRARGHAVDNCDLNAEGFDPVMSRQDRIEYYDVNVNRRRVIVYVDRLLAAEAILSAFPVWNMDPPAILRGFFDWDFLPSVSFDIKENGDYTNVRRLGVVCAYGGTRLLTFFSGDPLRH